MENNILLPRLSVNDETILLAEWLVKSGDFVKEGQPILIMETTKETSELNAPVAGYIKILVESYNEYKVGTLIAVITDELQSSQIEEDSAPETTHDTRQYTQKAEALLKKYSIDVSRLPTDRIIREKDIEDLIGLPYQIAETTSNNIIIYGGGGIVKVIIDMLNQNRTYKLQGIVNVSYPHCENEIMGVKVIGNNGVLSELLNKGTNKVINAMVAVNQKEQKVRKSVYQMLKKMHFEFPNIIHNTAIIEPSITMGEGNLICANTVISSNVLIGSNCIINSSAVVNHDCIISDHCHVTSGAIIAGEVTIGENSIIGQGSTIYHHVKIGKNVIIQNGCHIYNDIPDNTIVKTK
jgi:sugar O-acyltransferase (sialic acid O-acetyltransferase NeuD family)